ncbi:phosphate-starvation-inducible PsiE family protein [Halobellus ruber]|uniref:Phosphate-starvation-inducible PsiE family protein n=1 Tax=Halobellus ruber TaxID=2761102 RepID=A0A7J9SMM0_9EURY|nr:phosphate-starvation-inducible PsiE family protein [Halobellus ruber]
MSDETSETANGGPSEPVVESSDPRLLDIVDQMDGVVNIIEVAAGALFALLFAIGVFDLGLQIAEATLSGTITDPNIVIGFIDVGLLLLIIVEVYQTVVAYIRENDTRRIVRLVIYTGVIAVVRKVIIFRTSEYSTTQDALIVAIAYGILALGLVALLYVDRRTSKVTR